MVLVQECGTYNCFLTIRNDSVDFFIFSSRKYLKVMNGFLKFMLLWQGTEEKLWFLIQIIKHLNNLGRTKIDGKNTVFSFAKYYYLFWIWKKQSKSVLQLFKILCVLIQSMFSFHIRVKFHIKSLWLVYMDKLYNML